MTQAQYTRQELDRLQLGWLVREQPQRDAQSSQSLQRAKQQAREGHQQARDEMLSDIGFE